ncbi:tryptophanyl-tRNA synthetase [Dothidotthia symphoricarpi CBS 119687]|uniref:Tryptophan--tRNA ligase, mitochondrial n=1 Tax=Dothidotthia symphoricarpi CBS 119687 TaxID=1392245 RepID=A0A6A6AAJ0_9PLEO|nr:tryptophanyl-tRNA synthetase [Dothidotthia symphoricarpi CBS 119687]KAF2128576.1 tryptophanyl-tRNA synthetase [Dothidotthia symphoricarpi CBS 119687]
MLSLRTLRRAAPLPFRLCANCVQNASTESPLKKEHGKKQVIFSGIQPTGVPHLGNYLGALRQWVKLQNDASPDTTLLFSIVDLHAITIKQDPRELAQWRREMLASLLAVGLDPKRSIIFAQSSVKQHAELMWILSCGASMGYLSRMTQWKSKLSLPQNASPLDPSPSNKDALKLGLFSYPVLQAADILLYNTTHVPVGEDQAQHLEFTRDLAIGFNHLYASDANSQSLLAVPQTLLSPAKRVMSLTDPTKKMSKSDPKPKSRILITDSRDEIHGKIKTALTDSVEGVSYDRDSRPGVTNLIDLMYHFDEAAAGSPEELAADLKDLSMRALKERVVDTIDGGIRDIRERYGELMGGDQKVLVEQAEVGAQKAEKIAEETMGRVRSAMGIGW